jgi:hypothetical protein
MEAQLAKSQHEAIEVSSTRSLSVPSVLNIEHRCVLARFRVDVATASASVFVPAQAKAELLRVELQLSEARATAARVAGLEDALKAALSELERHRLQAAR